MLSLLGLTFLPSAFEIDQGLEKFQNPYLTYIISIKYKDFGFMYLIDDLFYWVNVCFQVTKSLIKLKWTKYLLKFTV